MAEHPLPRAETVARLPVVALVGRPNTGKSTLFNRLTRTRRALVAPVPGVTRDRNVAVADQDGRRLLLVDTGGFEADEQEPLAAAVRAQALLAAEQADVVVLVVDGRAGLNPLDRMLLDRLRGLPQPVLVAVNKIDTPGQDALIGEFHALGVDPVLAISAEHGGGIAALVSEVIARLPPPADGGEAADADADTPTAVAIIGRPNVGKSSLLNRLAGYERAIVSPLPGTTRDALDTPVTHRGREYVLVDTAGVRRRARVAQHLERASVVRALRALERAEVGLLVIDAIEGMTEQDARVAGYAWERGRALVLLVNKWDAVEPGARDAKAFAARIDQRFPSLALAPKLFVSARSGRGVSRIWDAIDTVAAHHRVRLPTAKLNGVIGRAVTAQQPPLVHGARLRVFYATQTAFAPPTITIFCSDPRRVAPAYERYLANQLRGAFELTGTPLRLRFRARERRGQRRPRA
jgi:GTP-binding protein